MKSKTDVQAFGAAVAAWIAERTGERVAASACADTLAAGDAIIAAARVPVLIADLLPVSRLEMLYVPPEGTPAGPSFIASFSGKVSRAVLRSIGRTVRAEFDSTGADMLRFELGTGAALFLHSPEVRETVNQAAASPCFLSDRGAYGPFWKAERRTLHPMATWACISAARPGTGPAVNR